MTRKIYKLGSIPPATAAQRESFAAMLRERRPPGIAGTDAINFAGIANCDPFPNVPNVYKDRYYAAAKAAGVSLSGKVYKSSLVRPEFAGRFDPEALVDSTGDVKRVVEKNGWESHGIVESDGIENQAESPLDKPYRVADDLVAERVESDLVAAGVDRISKREYLDISEKTRSLMEGTK